MANESQAEFETYFKKITAKGTKFEEETDGDKATVTWTSKDEYDPVTVFTLIKEKGSWRINNVDSQFTGFEDKDDFEDKDASPSPKPTANKVIEPTKES